MISFCKGTLWSIANEMRIPLHNITYHNDIFVKRYNSKFWIMSYFFNTFQPRFVTTLLLEILDSRGKYRNSYSEVFYKSSCSEKCLENSQENVRRIFFRVRGMNFFLWIFRKFSEQLRLDEIVFKERDFRQTVGEKLKSRDFIDRRMLITVISLFPVYF